jgi:carbonic anhydrase
MDFLPFSYVDSQVVESVQRLRDARLFPAGFAVHGFVYEVKTGRVRLVI